MSQRDKHLLEVFKNIGPGQEPPPAPVEPREPILEPRPRLGDEVDRVLSDSTGRLAAIVLAVAISFCLGLLVGTRLVPAQDQVAAAEPEARQPEFSDRAPAERRLEPFTQITPRTEQDLASAFGEIGTALFDPDNRYTVLAITYDSTDQNQALARATSNHFQLRSIPASLPYEREGNLYIMVGAAPSVSALEPLRDRVRAELDPAGRRGQYVTAYIEPIENIVGSR